MTMTFEDLGRWCRARLRKRKATFRSTCGQCRKAIAPGDTIARPFIPRRVPGAGAPHNSTICWYCADCADFFQRGVDCGALALMGPWLTHADKQAFEGRPDVIAWKKEWAARQARRDAVHHAS